MHRAIRDEPDRTVGLNVRKWYASGRRSVGPARLARAWPRLILHPN